MTDRTRLPLPDPFDYCYEWDGSYGTRKFSAAPYNGAPPARSVPLFTDDQMHAYADAETAALRAELAKHQESEFHPDWSMLSATRDSLAEHQDMIRRLSERVKVLELLVTDATYTLSKARIWNGMEWAYNPLHPIHYTPMRERLSNEADRIYAARAALESTR